MPESFIDPSFVLSTHRKPVIYKTYFVFINGKKDIYSMADLIKYHENYPNQPYLWLDMKDTEAVQVYLNASSSKQKVHKKKKQFA